MDTQEIIQPDIFEFTPAEYGADEISKAVHVDASVLNELINIIDDHMRKCGLYHRIFSRIKTPDSLAHKFSSRKYGIYDYKNQQTDTEIKLPKPSKIQDLIGIRINLYYEDDLFICRDILEECFVIDNWSASEATETEFCPSKINGVFRIPNNLIDKISPETWDMFIDQTFEIQLKTMFFEGWHEIEHDMRYKNKDIWAEYKGPSRHFNSILATLELCDKSMITLLEDFAHDLYKQKHWDGMIRMHYRVKMEEAELYPELKTLLDNSENDLAKQLFKCDREVLIRALFKKNVPIQINVNSIIAIINENHLHSPEITKIMDEHKVYLSGKKHSALKIANQDPAFKTFKRNRTFHGIVSVGRPNTALQKNFESCRDILYRWAFERYHTIFEHMPKKTQSFSASTYGYELNIHIDDANHSVSLCCSHVALDMAGKIWLTEANVYENNSKLMLSVENGSMDVTNFSKFDCINFFSFPNFYKQICDKLSICDVETCYPKPTYIHTEDGECTFHELVHNKERLFPIVCFSTNQKSLADDASLGNFQYSTFLNHVWRYNHIYKIETKLAKKLLSNYTEQTDDEPGVYVIYPMQAQTIPVIHYSADEICKCKYNGKLGRIQTQRIHNVSEGASGFRQKLIDELKYYNIIKPEAPIRMPQTDFPQPSV